MKINIPNKPTITSLHERILQSYCIYRYSADRPMTPRFAARRAFEAWGLDMPISPDNEHHRFWQELVTSDGTMDYTVGEWDYFPLHTFAEPT